MRLVNLAALPGDPGAESATVAPGSALIDSYAAYFARKLDRLLLDPSRSPLQRIANFIADASHGIERHHFKRGCLIANLGQEMNSLPEAFRVKLEAAFLD